MSLLDSRPPFTTLQRRHSCGRDRQARSRAATCRLGLCLATGRLERDPGGARRQCTTSLPTRCHTLRHQWGAPRLAAILGRSNIQVRRACFCKALRGADSQPTPLCLLSCFCAPHPRRTCTGPCGCVRRSRHAVPRGWAGPHRAAAAARWATAAVAMKVTAPHALTRHSWCDRHRRHTAPRVETRASGGQRERLVAVAAAQQLRSSRASTAAAAAAADEAPRAGHASWRCIQPLGAGWHDL